MTFIDCDLGYFDDDTWRLEPIVIVLKLRAAWERKRRRGERVEGRKPYGFHPAERALLERMKQIRKPARGKRLSYDAIAQQLNAEGHTTRCAKPWTRVAVHTVMSREAR